MGFNDCVAIADLVLKTIISGGVGWIGWLTYKTNSDKLKLELYNRRLCLYTSAYDAYITSILNTDQFSEANKAALINFSRHAAESAFLFGQKSEVFKWTGLYLQELKKPREQQKLEDLLAKLSLELHPWLDFQNITKSKKSPYPKTSML